MAENPPDPPENSNSDTSSTAAPAATGRIVVRDLKQELSASYIDYAMSVIIGRAIPDVRDGMKPVQRRILYSMYVNNFFYNRPHHKSATIVGHVIGHYHPHGDMAVYDALVRMAQDFSMRFPLIDGQGNFGSIDGDAPAAYRYTEARLAQISGELLEDLDKNTVNFIENFDGSEKEPAYLPAKLPALLLNGATGIAVGMSTNIAPHNLNEIVDAICAAIDMGPANFNPIEALKYIKGPDFPTGATIIGRQGIVDAITTGRGSIIVRSKAEILTEGKRDVIIVSEIPYMLNKARLIEIIAEHVNKGDIPEIADVRDESDRKGMRIYIELKKGVDSNACLNKLYMKTPMQSSFGIINLALVNDGKQPKILNYAEIIQEFITHREDVVKRRTEFELKKAQDRLHIIVGLLIAINNIDAVVQLIKKSVNISDATQGLMTQFSLSEIQAGEILKMPLSRLTNLQTQKLKEEDDELKAKVKEYQDILADRQKILGIIKTESQEIAAKYGNPRRTQIEEGDAAVKIDYKETVPEEDCVIILTKDQQIKRMTLQQYQTQNRGGKGKRGVQMREEDFVLEMFIAHSHDTILLFTQQGRVYSIPAYNIPLGSRTSRGKAVVNYVNLQPNEHVIDLVNISDFEAAGLSLVFVSAKGIIKKSTLDQFANIRRTGIHCMSVRDDDELVCVKLCVPGDNIMIATKSGWAVRFQEDELRPIGRTAMGVKGVRLRDEKDRVSDLVVAPADTNILSITKRGFGKMSKMDLYRLTHRGGKGVINIKLREETDEVIATKAVIQDMNLLLASKSGNLIRVRTEDIRQTGRAAKGVIVMRLEEDDEITSVALCEPSEEEDESTLSKPESLDNGDDEPEEEVIEEINEDQDHQDDNSSEG